MTVKEKILFVFLLIITLGLIWFYWNSKAKKQGEKNVLSTTETNLNLLKLIELLGGKENINNVESTHTKVKIQYNNRDLINVEEIKKYKGVSGVFINDKAITLIVGNSALYVSDKITSLL